jgi:alkanesulfonate monooxygenase SsuD/methylene tetrahydromethanopterin reductase-like flavin-dependent oxidoreductase (luciferase family)
MRIHCIFEPDSPERLCALGLSAERSGFDSVWLPNMLSARDPFLALAKLACASQTIRMGPVAISPFELHPLKIANSLLTLNELSGGRASLVVGGGGGTMIGMGLKPDRRATHPHMLGGVAECLEFLQRAVKGEAFNFDGRLFQVRDYRPVHTGLAAPRIWLAANGPRMLALAARSAGGVMLSDISLSQLPATLDILRTELTDAGRPVAGYPLCNLLAWHVHPDREVAYAEARRKLWVRGLWQRSRLAPYIDAADCELIEASLPVLAAAYAQGIDPSPAVPRRIMDALAEGLTLVGDHGDLDGLLARVRAFRDAGITDLALRLYGSPETAIRLVAERIAPFL